MNPEELIQQFQEGKMLLIDKPHGWTSFDVVGRIRVLLKQKLGIKKIKAGHAGTLDPLATGLLIICTGKLTKRIDEFQAQEKEYSGTFVLGAVTASFDLETEVEQKADYTPISDSEIKAAAKRFTGKLLQIPPVFSAIKVDGKRAYESARKGKSVVLAAREVNIREFDILGINLPEVSFRVVCSKGTYIRSLARDFGEDLACGAYLSSLSRMRIGSYRLDDAQNLLEFEDSLK